MANVFCVLGWQHHLGPESTGWASSKTLPLSPPPLSHTDPAIPVLPPTPLSWPKSFQPVSGPQIIQHISSWAFSPWMLFSPQIWADTFQFCPGLHKEVCMKLKQLIWKIKLPQSDFHLSPVVASSHYPQHLALGTLDGISFHTAHFMCYSLSDVDFPDLPGGSFTHSNLTQLVHLDNSSSCLEASVDTPPPKSYLSLSTHLPS